MLFQIAQVEDLRYDSYLAYLSDIKEHRNILFFGARTDAHQTLSLVSMISWHCYSQDKYF